MKRWFRYALDANWPSSGGGGGGTPDDNSVSTAKIQNGAVTAAKVAADVATQAELDAVAAAAQPLDSDLTAIAALSTTSFGRALLALADAADGRAVFGLGTAATQASSAFDSAGAAAAAQAASQPLDSDLTAIAALATTSFGRSLLAAADAAALRSSAGLVIGTDVVAFGDSRLSDARTPTSHASSHQEIVGSDSLVNYGLFERIRRVRSSDDANGYPIPDAANNADSTMQSGHGWVQGAGKPGTYDFNYTSDFFFGSQCIRVITDGAGGTSRIELTRVAALDLRSRACRIRFKIVSGIHFSKLNVWLGSGASAFVNNSWRTIQSGVALDEYAQPGEWVTFTFNLATLAGPTGTLDASAIRDFRIDVIDDAGGTCEVLIGGLDFFDEDTTFPNGVVSFVFDDGYASPYTIARPKLEQYGYRPTLYLIRNLLGVASYMTKAQLDAWQQAGAEVAFHSDLVADHNSTNGFVGLSNATLMANFGTLKGYMHQNAYRGVEHMALPKGRRDATLGALLKQQFAAVRTTNYRSIETLPVGDPYRLRCWGLDSTTVIAPNSTVASVEWFIDQIYTYGGWMILLIHEIVASGASGSQVTTADFNTLVDYVASKRVAVRTVGDVLGVI